MILLKCQYVYNISTNETDICSLGSNSEYWSILYCISEEVKHPDTFITSHVKTAYLASKEIN
jgi:hypothetical protein